MDEERRFLEQSIDFERVTYAVTDFPDYDCASPQCVKLPRRKAVVREDGVFHGLDADILAVHALITDVATVERFISVMVRTTPKVLLTAFTAGIPCNQEALKLMNSDSSHWHNVLSEYASLFFSTGFLETFSFDPPKRWIFRIKSSVPKQLRKYEGH